VAEAPHDIRSIEAFLFLEAALLDERRYEEWLDLFTEDAHYWIPMERGQENPFDTVSLIYDDRMSMELRVRQFDTPNRHAQAVKTWTSHVIGNVMVAGEDQDGALIVTSNCHVLEAKANSFTTLPNFVFYLNAQAMLNDFSLNQKQQIIPISFRLLSCNMF